MLNVSHWTQNVNSNRRHHEQQAALVLSFFRQALSTLWLCRLTKIAKATTGDLNRSASLGHPSVAPPPYMGKVTNISVVQDCFHSSKNGFEVIQRGRFCGAPSTADSTHLRKSDNHHKYQIYSQMFVLLRIDMFPVSGLLLETVQNMLLAKPARKQ